ncbi:flagellar hook protein FlgE [Maritalea myrionectae]|uniref:Flagellar hook protein FlgE n=1 Tax=Maritalea myrionectae TaxID=454601 RepID=A0A2R4MDQ2_9HYPH|nr:flagellar hook-basal body complex protein [Maritalea myrionectae]AVX04054.1 flagellar hook protein FlgE [Maritalea myrionectae]
MGIYGALSTAVTGLQAQSFALEHISGNIANSQTTAYKRIETDFVDLIPDAPVSRQVAGAVMAQSRATNDLQGDVTTAGRNTYMAINGDGFFVVEQKIGTNDGNAVFGGTDFYTRRGDFDVDKEGYLVNGSNAFLKGLPIDSVTGNVAGSVPEVIQLDNAFLPAQRTAVFNYQLNLPQLPKNAGYDPINPNSELLDTADYTDDPTTGGGGFVTANESDKFLSDSIAGGAITVYAENGAPANVQLRWAKTDSYANGGSDTWNLFYQSDADATGTDPQWQNVGTDYVFGTNGSLSPTIASVSLTGLTIDGINIGDVTLQHGSNGVTQFADPNGTTEVTKLSQNGYPAGEFVSVEVNREGRIVANYSNGKKVELAQVVTANFNAVNELKRYDGGLYSATSESGTPILDIDGNVTGAALEQSNTDISEEFTKLIVTQQAYSAGTRIVTSSDEMLQEALNMVR